MHFEFMIKILIKYVKWGTDISFDFMVEYNDNSLNRGDM